MRKQSFIAVAIACFVCLIPQRHYAQQKMENPVVILNMENVSLREVMKQIETVTEFKFLAKAEEIENEKNITINTKGTLSSLLEKILAGRNLEYKIIDKSILIKRPDLTNQRSTAIKADKAQNYSVHGSIKSAANGEAIIGASITVVNNNAAAVSNDYGFYSITLPQGSYNVLVSAIGMKTKLLEIDLIKDIQLTVLLEEETKTLETVTVTTNTTSASLRTAQMSVEKINVQEVKNVPILFGERDILKTIQLLPGVKSAGEGNSGFYVRGGGADQNLILLDEAPVYNASHLLGFFSTFNSDAIKNVTLYKGAMPSQYGGRLSSVVDIKMNDGNNQDVGVSGGIGLIASRLNIEGPIQKNKSSFLLSARRTYADVFLKLLGDSSMKKTKLYFYDLNAKMNFTLGEKDRLYLSGYFGRDVLSQEELAGINWGNATGTLRWNHIFNKKLFSNTSLIFSNYDYKINVNTEANDYGIFSRIRDYNLKEEMQWYGDSKNTLSFGLNAIYHTIKPGEISVGGNNGSVAHNLQSRYSLENAVFASNNWRPGSNWNINYGIRLSAFSIMGKGDYYTLNTEGKVIDTLHYNKGEVVKTYINPEPRFAASYNLNNYTALKFSYSRNTQNLHLISNSTSSSPTDKWVASTNIIKPEIADQVALGYYKSLSDSRYALTVEAYYKTMQQQVDYRNGAQVFTNQAIETQLLFGKGRAYGMEWMFKKNGGRLSGWISYVGSPGTELEFAL